MPTRNLEVNQNKTNKALLKIQKQATKSLARDYKLALDLIRAELLKRVETFGDLTNDNLSRFDRRKKLIDAIYFIVNDLTKKNNRKIRRLLDIQYKQSYFRNAWCVDQNLGVKLRWRIKKGDEKR